MIILIPGFSAIVTEKQFHNDTEVRAQYSELYVVCEDGSFRLHQSLSGGRTLTSTVTSVPPLKKGAKTELPKQGYNLLPDGPIPYDLFVQAHRFFVDVMKTFQKEHEAGLHILWEKDKGYYIAVPTQTVDKASVKYQYDHIPTGAVMVVDIHSHNTMSAFFSGTDNRDDKHNVMYSGVFGNLDKAHPSTVWRANFNGNHPGVELSEIFAVPMPEAQETPADWLSKVSEKKYTASQGTGRNRWRPKTSSTTQNHRTTSAGTTGTNGSNGRQVSSTQTTASKNLNGTAGNKPNSNVVVSTQTSGQNTSTDVEYEGTERYAFDIDTLEILDRDTGELIEPEALVSIAPEDIDMSPMLELEDGDVDAICDLYSPAEIHILATAFRLEAAALSMQQDPVCVRIMRKLQLGSLDFPEDGLESDLGIDQKNTEHDNASLVPSKCSPDYCKKQALLWYKGVEENPEAQLDLLRSLFNSSSDDVTLAFSQNGY